MTVSELLDELTRLDVRLEAKEGRLRVDAPVGVVDDRLRAALAEHKAALLEMLDWYPALDGMTVPIYTPDGSVIDYYQLKRRYGLRVVSCEWDGKGPVTMVVTGPPSMRAISEGEKAR